MSNRCVALQQKSGTEIDILVGESLLRLAKIARAAKKDDVAIRSVMKLKKMQAVSSELNLAADVEEARYFWNKGFLLDFLICRQRKLL